MIKNYFQLIWDLNQSSNYQYKMYCSLFSFAHNLYFNTWIWLDYNDIQEIAKLCKDKWLLDDEKWGFSKCFEVAFDYVKKLNLTPKIRLIKTTSWTSTYKDLVDNNYMLRIWIWITKEWLKDIRDWAIDTVDYSKIKWEDFKHFLNIWNIKTNQYNGTYLIDNYFGKHISVIKADLKEIEKISYPTIYAVTTI